MSFLIGFLTVIAILALIIWNMLIIVVTVQAKGSMQNKIDTFYDNFFQPEGTLIYWLAYISCYPAYSFLRFLYWKPRLPFKRAAK